jgi:hypothetical protein
MKSKTLITMAVASTFGWSAASFAGAGHEVVTPFSPNESGEVIFSYKQGFGSSDQLGATGSVSDSGAGTVSGSHSGLSGGTNGYTDAGDATGSFSDSLAAADQGVYSDYHIVGFTPMSVQTWDYYLIDNGGTPELVAIGGDFDVWMPTHELALVPSASDEMIYELALVPTTFGEMSMTDDLSGE